MNKGQILDKIVTHIDTSPSGPVRPATTLHYIVDLTDYIYSYLVYARYDNSHLTGWDVQVMISHTAQYNALPSAEAILSIVDIVNNSWSESTTKYIVGYKQPPLPLLMEILEPMVQSLAAQQHRYWQQIEYDDLCQMCRLVIVTLYNKGYYIHKSLVSKSFVNNVLMSLRKERHKPLIISLEQLRENEGNSPTTLQIQDPVSLDHIVDLEEEDKTSTMRQRVINEIGPRQYEQMVFEYKAKATTQETVNQVRQLKRKFGGKYV